jgi:hypothetical protein
MKLVYRLGSPTHEVKIGDRVTTFRGEHGTLIGIEKPHKPSSTGRVTVRMDSGYESSFYPSVIGAEWIERDDQVGGADVAERRK